MLHPQAWHCCFTCWLDLPTSTCTSIFINSNSYTPTADSALPITLRHHVTSLPTVTGVPSTLTTDDFVFLHLGGHHAPLVPSYCGPFRILQWTDKMFTTSTGWSWGNFLCGTLQTLTTGSALCRFPPHCCYSHRLGCRVPSRLFVMGEQCGIPLPCEYFEVAFLWPFSFPTSFHSWLLWSDILVLTSPYNKFSCLYSFYHWLQYNYALNEIKLGMFSTASLFTPS